MGRPSGPRQITSVAGSARFVRSDLHGLERFGLENEAQRILGQAARAVSVVSHVGNTRALVISAVDSLEAYGGV